VSSIKIISVFQSTCQIVLLYIQQFLPGNKFQKVLGCQPLGRDGMLEVHHCKCCWQHFTTPVLQKWTRKP